MNLTINNLIKGVQVAPFLACFVLAGSVPKIAKTKNMEV